MPVTVLCVLVSNNVSVSPSAGKKKPAHNASGEAILQILERQPEILQQLLATVLNIIMYEDCRNQWSMSRPLLGLILLNEEYFGGLREQMVLSHPPERQPAIRAAFDSLMDGIERNLLTKNRDR